MCLDRRRTNGDGAGTTYAWLDRSGVPANGRTCWTEALLMVDALWL